MADPQVKPNTVAVVDPYGTLGTLDASEAKDALNNGGFRLASQDELKNSQLQSEYGDGTGNSLKAFGLGALSTATFGLGNEALAKTGIVPSEEQAALSKFHGLATGAGNVAGVAGMLAAPEFGAAGAAGGGAEGALGAADLVNPVKAVSKVGSAITEASTPFAEKAASLIANPETSPIAHRILSQAGASAMGSAVEGMAYGLGQSVNEDALGDPDALGEKLFANVGLNGLFGAGMGAIIGATSGALRKVPGTTDLVTAAKGEAGAAQDTFESTVKTSGISDEEKESLLDGLKKQKPEAEDIRSAASDLGVPTFVGQVTDSPSVQKMWGIYADSPSPYGMKEAQVVHEAFEKVGSQIQHVMAPEGSEVGSLADVGDALQNSVASKMEVEIAPTKALYDEIGQYTPAIPLSEKSIQGVQRNILKLIDDHSLIKGTPARQFVENTADSIGELNNLQQLRNLRTELRKQAPLEAKYIAGKISEKIDNMEVGHIERFAETMKTPEAKDRVLSLLDKVKQARQEYAAFRDKMSTFGKVLGKKNFAGPEDFLHYITEETTPEKFADKMFQKKNSRFLDFFKSNFPDEAQHLADYQKGQLFSKNMEKGIGSVLRAVDRLEPEAKGFLFNPDQLSKLESAKKWVNAFPDHFNPSKTAVALGWMGFLKNPAEAALQTARDVSLKHGFQRLGLTSAEEAKVHTLSALERTGQSMSGRIKTGAAALFRSQLNGSAGSVQSADNDEIQKKANQIRDFASNPEKMIDTLDKNTKDIYGSAPNASGAAQAAASRAVSFLAQKLPQNPQAAPLSPSYVPNKSELSKFSRYVNAVENPISALHQVKQGTITPEMVETLQSVYPSLYKEMQTEVISSLSSNIKSGKTVPFKVKLGLSMLLGKPLDDALDPAALASNQASLGSLSQPQQSPGMYEKGLGNMTKPNRMLTAMQQSAQRAET